MKTPMLLQADKLYTAPIFEAFQAEYERSMAAFVREQDGNNIYAIAIVRSDGDFSSEKSAKQLLILWRKQLYVAMSSLKGQGCCVPMF